MRMKSTRWDKLTKSAGFTIVEMTVAIVVMLILTVFFILQRQGLERTSRDQMRKQAINSMYYALKEGYHKDKGYYPRTIDRETLPEVDPTLFTDPSGYTLDGDSCVYTNNKDKQATNGKCEYHYSAFDCDKKGKCKDFTLTADLENEANYKKSSKK